jgi:ribosomal protein S18 acetylase RimI-like enzyme
VVGELERALDFLALADHGGTRREPFAYGTAVFDDRLPRRWDSNYLLVQQVPDGIRAEELAAEAERLQAAAGLAHRKIELRDEELGARLEPQFRALGWTVNRHLLMAMHRRPDRVPDPALVHEVDAATLRDVRARQMQSYEWGADPEVLEQLYAAKTFLAQVVDARFFAVLLDGQPVSWTDLYLANGTAQIEDVGTLSEHRGHGYASALVLHAATAARRAGADFVFLVADDEDWPKELYRKLGFDDLGRVYEYLLSRS